MLQGSLGVGRCSVPFGLERKADKDGAKGAGVPAGNTAHRRPNWAGLEMLEMRLSQLFPRRPERKSAGFRL